MYVPAVVRFDFVESVADYSEPILTVISSSDDMWVFPKPLYHTSQQEIPGGV